ncbi:MAG TPA: hypothetical protein DDX47_03190 [Candidatus Jacksonbacteria bacterium]|nr:MAG: hypothetical protein UW45_C0006G0032 [Parcubacteria group bacterium GW2011_GWC2_44_22]HBH46344.1 hypothetical protein [Candidatus Jacksonbacteria bacterium]HCC50552.1 hypothetical protein [Candidatus Jacksonbacteria bacterium]HCE49243.1 hypothetical protein [Candidatus Jacksonbacteria bacterium]HCR15196.1 hypothetical protein [Candidatus Jacksonbacteria bacterium]
MISQLLYVFLISMTPLGELRAGIPYGLIVGANPVLVLIFAIAGNMVPIALLLWLLPYLEKKLGISDLTDANVPVGIDNSSPAENQKNLKNKFRGLYYWYRKRNQLKHSKSFARWGALALVTFVAIPLPMTGGWSGALLAHIFAVPFKKALLLVGLGVAIAGMIVSAITIGLL